MDVAGAVIAWADAGIRWNPRRRERDHLTEGGTTVAGGDGGDVSGAVRILSPPHRPERAVRGVGDPRLDEALARGSGKHVGPCPVVPDVVGDPDLDVAPRVGRQEN